VERPDGENGQAGHRDRLSEKVNKQNNYKQKNTTDSASLPSFLSLHHLLKQLANNTKMTLLMVS
jgi:hypothetical protein